MWHGVEPDDQLVTTNEVRASVLLLLCCLLARTGISVATFLN